MPLPIDARNLRQARGKHREGTQQQHVRVFGRNAVRADIGEQAGHGGVDFIGESGEIIARRRPIRSGNRGYCHVLRFWQCGNMAIWQRTGIDIHSRQLCLVEEGVQRDAMSARVQASCVLLVGFSGLVSAIKTAQAMIEGTPLLAQPLSQRKAQVAPVIIS
nr:hypothetical protein [Bacteroides oleiciplenus]